LYEKVDPDGRTETLLSVPRFDFAWQSVYRFVEPVKMPKGSKLHCTAHFDNSEKNLSNPDPTRAVTWGDQTWEEMMIGWVDFVFDRLPDQEEKPAQNPVEKPVEKPAAKPAKPDQPPDAAKPGGAQAKARQREGSLRVGDRAPDFAVKDVDGQTTTKLSALRGKPTVLIFGSCT
jgi:hypothetical protein